MVEYPAGEKVVFHKSHQALYLAFGEGVAGFAEFCLKTKGLHEGLIVLLPDRMALQITVQHDAFHMIDLSKVQNYYVACGYTDLRRGIDGLAAIVSQQYGGCLSEESLFLFCGRRTDRIKALYWSGDGPPEFSLAHGGTENRAADSNPQRKAERPVLSKNLN